MTNQDISYQSHLVGDGTTLKWRKSSSKEDSRRAAKYLIDHTDISPYTESTLTSTIRSAAKSGELSFRSVGRTQGITNLREWFEKRVKPNTISLTRENYLTALANSFELITIGDPAKTDFGSSRQREFGQQWTDFTRGYLGEIAVKRFFQERFDVEVALRQRESEEGVEEYLPTDVTEVRTESGGFRPTESTLSVKTSKLGSMWLAIPSNQLGHSSAFTLAKIGIPLNHLSIFLKETNALETMLGYVDREDAREILESIPDFQNIPAYIPGFAWQEDYRQGTLDIHEASKVAHVRGGIGKRPETPPEGYSRMNVQGLGDPNEEYLASLGALHWRTSEWEEFLDRL